VEYSGEVIPGNVAIERYNQFDKSSNKGSFMLWLRHMERDFWYKNIIYHYFTNL
jgi:hypothetical protein